MANAKQTKGKLPWHSAFYAGLQIEFEEEADKLTFENEHQLGTDPMRIDVLIIKKNEDEPIKKNIGRIFRDYNIIEYKSPEQYLSIDAFYKVLGYACFYKSDVQYVDTIKAEKITISYVSKSYPRKLIHHLKHFRGYQLVPKNEGIWYIEGGMFPMQLIVTSKLSNEDNFWLRNLTNDFKEKSEADKMFEEYSKHADSKLHKSVMDLIMRANEQIFKEAKGNMCDALRELFKEEFDEIRKNALEAGLTEGRSAGLAEGLAEGRSAGLTEGQLSILKKLVDNGKLSLSEAAEQLDISVEEFQSRLVKTF